MSLKSLVGVAVRVHSRCKEVMIGLTCWRSPIGCRGSGSWCSVLGLSIWVVGIRRHGSLQRLGGLRLRWK